MEDLQTVELEVKERLNVSNKSIFYIGKSWMPVLSDLENLGFKIAWISSISENVALQFPMILPDAIICEHNPDFFNVFKLYKEISSQKLLKSVPFIIIGTNIKIEEIKHALSIGVNDVYSADNVTAEDIKSRLDTLRKIRSALDMFKPVKDSVLFKSKTIPQKRLFDIAFSLLLIILFFPIMLLIAILIKLESPGPIFYISQRVGTGYQLFKFYKFRSMHTNADKQLEKLKHLNQYSENGTKTSFVKISNDPRITKVGKFIRKTSIDELPQLFNVLKGDMSLVGNRPLPLYEAEMLTTDLWAKRFLAPAGITGLWQVTKRGKNNMSESERMLLDVDYADKTSFWFDMKILMKTATAFIQKETV